MLVDKRSELSRRIILLQRCVDDAISKVDNLSRLNEENLSSVE